MGHPGYSSVTINHEFEAQCLMQDGETWNILTGKDHEPPKSSIERNVHSKKDSSNNIAN